ncbi:MAG: hypothetical protein NTW87_06695 [Planctomycetota bacterium]|nr:hypothetical protein [Planctomycetota bacterium]
MTYKGKVTNGVVVLEDPKALPEGTVVAVEPMGAAEDNGESLPAMLLRHAGKGKDLPSDLARNHDHYLHGRPRTTNDN